MENKAALKESIRQWLRRYDIDANLDEMIRRGENRMLKEKRLAIVDKDASYDFTTPTDRFTLPADFGVLKWMRAQTSEYDYAMDFQDDTEFYQDYPYTGTVQNQRFSQFFTISGTGTAGEIEIIFEDSATADDPWTGTVGYIARFIPLALDTDTNWFLQAHEDIYVNSCLVDTSAFIGNDPRMATWSVLYDDACEKLWEYNKHRRRAAGGKYPRPRSAVI